MIQQSNENATKVGCPEPRSRNDEMIDDGGEPIVTPTYGLGGSKVFAVVGTRTPTRDD